VAASGDHSPADSRLVAVEAATRHPTVEAMAALGTLLFADPRTEAPVAPLGHDGPVWVTDATAGLFVTGSHDGTARLWSDDGTLDTALDHGAVVRAAAVAAVADPPVIATGSDDGIARVWTADGEVVGQAGHDDQINAVALDADATMLVSASSDGRVLVTDIASGRLDHELVHDDIVWSVALSEDRRRSATGSADGVARLWDLHTGEVIVSHDLNQSVTVVSFSPTGSGCSLGV